MQYSLRRKTAPLPGSLSGTAPSASDPAGPWSRSYGQILIVAGVAGFSAHVFILAVRGLNGYIPLWSNWLQSMLGVLAVLALVEAGRTSRHFARRVWLLSALAVAVYSAGQALFAYYRIHAIGPHVTDPF